MSLSQLRDEMFAKRSYRAKVRDTQAVVVTRRNGAKIAKLCQGTVIDTPQVYAIKFPGVFETELVLEGEYFVRTILPGGEFFSAITPVTFLERYEKVADK